MNEGAVSSSSKLTLVLGSRMQSKSFWLGQVVEPRMVKKGFVHVLQVDSGMATALKAALAGQKPLVGIKYGFGGSPDKVGAGTA